MVTELIERIPICPHGSKDNVSTQLLHALDIMERALGSKLFFNSGFRCDACNRAAGGVANSAHTRGTAVDIHCTDSHTRQKITKAAFAMGFERIGIAKTFVHVDVDKELPQAEMWLY